jgi:hypothetical protein
MPLDKLDDIPTSIFDILLLEPVGEQEEAKLVDMYSTLENDSMVCSIWNHFNTKRLG